MTMLRWWVDPPRIHILSIAWAIVIFTLSAIPGKDLPQVGLLHIDKAAHVGVYAILAFFL